MVSRTHPGLLKRLFELEVPEIQDGTVEIKSVAREAGARSKIAVYSANSDVDCVGACVGPKGTQRASDCQRAPRRKNRYRRVEQKSRGLHRQRLKPVQSSGCRCF